MIFFLTFPHHTLWCSQLVYLNQNRYVCKGIDDCLQKQEQLKHNECWDSSCTYDIDFDM